MLVLMVTSLRASRMIEPETAAITSAARCSTADRSPHSGTMIANSSPPRRARKWSARQHTARSDARP